MDKVYVIMFKQRIMENTFYTDENKVSERVERLNEATNNTNYWYQTLERY